MGVINRGHSIRKLGKRLKKRARYRSKKAASLQREAAFFMRNSYSKLILNLLKCCQ